jgi:hypothetical protein
MGALATAACNASTALRYTFAAPANGQAARLIYYNFRKELK